MTKVTLHPPVKNMSGKLGIYTYRVMYGKQTLMKTPDMSKVKWSKAQKANRQRFKKAIAYARQAMADPKFRAYYGKAAKKAGRQPFRVAISDFLAGKNLLQEKPD
jgi:hypothetical protein